MSHRDVIVPPVTTSVNHIKQFRKSRGLTALELASKLGVREQTVFRYQSGEITPSLEMSRRIAEVLGVTVDELFPQPEQATA